MRRTTITLSAALTLLAFVPASALARHHHRRHHSRALHARIERFGDVTSTPTSSSSAKKAGAVQSFSGGRLTIMLVDGSMVSGMVTNDTGLGCTAREQGQTIDEDGDGASGDQSGSGDNQARGFDAQSSGEDQGDAAEQNEAQAEEQNENEAAEKNEAQNNCSTADLTHGTVVREAELRVSSAGSVWKKVELAS